MLETFKGIELKVSSVSDQNLMPLRSVDFKWACHSNLKKFELKKCQNLPQKVLEAITMRLASMPNLTSISIEDLMLGIAC